MPDTTATARRKTLGDRGLVVYTGLLTALGAFAIDSTLPMFVAMAADLGTPIGSLPQSITIFLFALGTGQMLFGPISDRFGRRPVLAIGLTLYGIGAALCYVAQSLDTMMIGRIIQGFGAGCGPAVARAMLRDRFTGDELAKQFAISVAVFSLGPILGPLLGVSLVALGGSWRLIYGCMALVALGLIYVLATRLPETLRNQRLNALKPAILVDNASSLLGHPQSRYFMMMNVLSYIVIVLIIAGSPVVFAENFGISGALFAVLFALHAVGVILGQFLNHRSIDRFGTVGTALWAATLMTVTLTGMWLLSLSGYANAYNLSALIAVFAIGFLTVQVNSNAMAMTPHGQIAGFAASFIGSSAQIIGSIFASALMPIVGYSVTRWTCALMVSASLVLCMLLLWIHNHGIRPAQIDAS